MKTTTFAAFAALTALLGATTARAEQGLIPQKAISLDMALAMTRGSLDKCRSMNYHCAISVLDATGRTIIEMQDDGAMLHRLEVVHKKAYTALVYRKPSKDVVEGWSKKTADAHAAARRHGAESAHRGHHRHGRRPADHRR